ncbi:MAG: hypothetical protein V2I47_04390, partial [Bacteroidales bacterium]|nr:hypothetical protein [Bacteroidales bacterium]
SGFGTNISSLFSIVDSNLVVIYCGLENHYTLSDIKYNSLIEIYKNYVLDDRVLLDSLGNYNLPLIDANWEYGHFKLVDEHIIEIKFIHSRKVF